MRLTPLGEELIILEDLEGLSPSALAAHLESLSIPGLIEAAPAWSSVGLHISPELFQAQSLTASLEILRPEALMEGIGNAISLPVCWQMGEDWQEVSEACGRSREEVTQMLEAEVWPVRFIGFQPGFPYCGPLPYPFTLISRRSSPRTRVPAGSVALAAGQLGIYPAESPGGWMLIGRTPLLICQPERSRFPIRPGDRLKFCSIGQDEFKRLQGEVL